MASMNQVLGLGGTSGVGASGTNRAGARPLNTYPHQYFDLSSQEVPKTIKELFRWAMFLYMSHSEIAPIIKKKCEYVLTDIVYDTEDVKNKEVWENVLENILNIKEFELEMLLDYEVYGNAFCSIAYPFDRFLECKDCGDRKTINDPDRDWKYEDHEFKGYCHECKENVKYKVDDVDIKHKKDLNLVRWFPEYINIYKSPITGSSEHRYAIPRWIRDAVNNKEKGANKYLVKDMPMPFLDAVKKGTEVLLDKDNFYHMKNISISYYDQNYGIPPMLSIFKDAWLYQTYRRAQEAIAIEHVLPLRLLVPRPISGDHSPHVHNDLGAWSARMQSITSRWRRDPNAWFTVPFPCEVQNIGGDAQALNVHNDMQILKQTITMGLDMPQDIMSGSVQYSGSTVALRILENSFTGRIKQLERLLNQFIIPRLRAWADLPDKIKIKHRDFKMADDAQQKQIAISLRQTNTISDRTVIKELGFDYATEQEYKRQEEEDRNAVLRRQMESQARAQGAAQVISAEFEAKAQVAAQKAAKEAQREDATEAYDDLTDKKGITEIMRVADSVKAPGPGNLGGSNINHSAMVLDTMAANFLSGTPPEAQDQILLEMKQKTPQLAAKILERKQLLAKTQVNMTQLPEQKPSKRV